MPFVSVVRENHVAKDGFECGRTDVKDVTQRLGVRFARRDPRKEIQQPIPAWRVSAEQCEMDEHSG